MKNAPQRVESGPVADAALRTRVLIADDQSILREGVRALLEGERGLELIGSSITPARPDLSLIHI